MASACDDNNCVDLKIVRPKKAAPGKFPKQVARTPAKVALSELPERYGFQFNIKIIDTTNNASKSILDKITLTYQKQNSPNRKRVHSPRFQN